jgi:hypothetical protein
MSPPPRHSSSDSPTRSPRSTCASLLQLDAMLAAIEDPIEAVAAVSVFLGVFAQ